MSRRWDRGSKALPCWHQTAILTVRHRPNHNERGRSPAALDHNVTVSANVVARKARDVNRMG